MQPGERNTKIEIKSLTSTRDADGFPVEKWTNIYGAGVYAYAKWINAFGQDVLTAQQLGAVDMATITVPYSALITSACEIYREGDTRPYEIIGTPDNIRNRNQFIEMKIKRKVKAAGGVT